MKTKCVSSFILTVLTSFHETMGSYLRRTNIVEGIGNEVIIGLGTFICLLVTSLAVIYNSTRRRSQEIHPDSAGNVETTRLFLHREEEAFNSNADQPRVVRQQNDGQLQCPICLAEASFAVETNCGHLFCGHCCITYWQHGQWLGAIRCPVCRQQVTLLLRNFTAEENLENSNEKQTVVDQINSYNRRFSGQPRPILDYIRDLPTLLRHAFNEFFSIGGLIWMFRMRVIMCFLAALFYFISPLDLIPEAAFGLLGFLDDFFIVGLLAIYITIIYRQVVEARAERQAMNAGPAS
ncbi:E3 ubiquitin-protein ligase RNF170-like [Gigantopelta aegis]|uniref:E3 ubiquitin-protein ligase RNF170-like n=1 Tax=Gigantopelta aegis TaxID=1735272 RepID=UPI001B889BD9|nr:E3 ubiquitin-protein ligase RNF170-like [Gigantopelta aegis]